MAWTDKQQEAIYTRGSNIVVSAGAGSGKTAVAASVCYTAVKNGMQTAFMAPTELLAEQHYKSFLKLFEGI